jgi:hypothetical protein
MSTQGENPVNCNKGHSASLSPNLQALQLNLFIENLSLEKAGDPNGEQIRKPHLRSFVLLITQLHPSWILRLEQTNAVRNQVRGLQISLAPITPAWKDLYKTWIMTGEPQSQAVFHIPGADSPCLWVLCRALSGLKVSHHLNLLHLIFCISL